MTVQFDLESVSRLPWNQCPDSRGITVQFAVESLSSLVWNTQASGEKPSIGLSGRLPLCQIFWVFVEECG